MIPETYISVSYVPSTVTGKADRKPLREQFTQLPGAQVKAYFGLDDKEKAMPLTATGTEDADTLGQSAQPRIAGDCKR